MNTRKFSRVTFNVDATVRAEGRTFNGIVENLSMKGMFIETEERLPVDTPVEISMVLTGTEPEISVGCSGKVSRVTDEGLGFSFVKIDIDSYTHLKNIIAYNIDDPEKVMEEIYHSIDEKIAEQDKN